MMGMGFLRLQKILRRKKWTREDRENEIEEFHAREDRLMNGCLIALVVGLAAVLVLSLAGCEASSLSDGDASYLESIFPEPASRKLAFAAAEGSTKKIRALVNDGVDVNVEGPDGDTALDIAVDFAQPQSIATLLELGADPNHEYGRGKSVMHTAIRKRNPEVLKMLLDGGGNPNLGADNRSALIVSVAMNGTLEEVKLLIDAGADPDGRGLNDDTAMMAAARGKRYETVYFLLEQGADFTLMNRADESLVDFIAGQTYVHVTGTNYYEMIVEFLRSNGEEVSPR